MAGVKGRSGGARPNSGPKSKRIRMQLEDVLSEAVPQEDRLDIFRVLTARARSGDDGCAKLVLGYIYGTPIQRQEVSGEDGGPIQFAAGDDEAVLAAAERIRDQRSRLSSAEE